MDFGSLDFGIALLGTAAAVYYDLTQNRTVPDWLTFGLVAVGIVAAALAFNPDTLGSVVIPVAVVVAVGYPLYRLGQIGGADVLLFTAIALLVPHAPKGILEAAQPAYFISPPFIASVFLASGVLFGVVMFLRFLPPCIGALAKGKVKLDAQKEAYAVAMFALSCAIIWMALGNGLPVVFSLVVAFSALVAVFFFVFKQFIAEKFMIRSVGIAQIDEEDVLAVEEMDGRIVKKYGLQKLLTAGEIAKLRKTGLKKFPVYKNLPPFTPYILAALVLSLLFGDLLMLALNFG